MHHPHPIAHITPCSASKFSFLHFTIISIILLQVLFSTILYAQHDNLLFNHLGLDDGLSEQTNVYVYKDTRGFVWIGSVSGLNRFDGTRIKVYMPDKQDSSAMFGENIQTPFFEDDHQRMWFATYDAINCYHPAVDSFSHYIYRPENTDMSGYYIFYLSDSLLWMCIEGIGLFRFNIESKKFSFVTPLQIFDCNRQGYIADAQGLKKVFAFDVSRPYLEEITLDEDQKVIRKQILEVNGRTELFPSKIISEGDSIVWIGTKFSIIRLNLQHNTVWELAVDGLLSLEHLNDSIILISTKENGVWNFDKRQLKLISQILHNPADPYSLHSDRINYISRVKDGSIWLNTIGQGLSYAFPGKKKFKQSIPYQENVEKIKFVPIGFYEESDGKVFCITEAGNFYSLDKISGDANEHPLQGYPLQNRKVHRTIKDDNNNIWLSTYNGIGLIKPDRKKIEWASNHKFIAWDALEMRNGKIIVGTAGLGLYEALSVNNSYTLNQIDQTVFQEEYLPHFQDSKGTIWASSHVKKIILIDEGLKKVVAEIAIQGAICHLIESTSTNTVWVASSTGLYEVDTRNYSIRAVHQEAVNGCTGFTNMLQDRYGNLWLTCKNQVAVFDTSSKSFKVFVEEDGMPNTQFKRYGATQFSDGEMWFPFTGGFVKFHPEHISSININAIPQITACFINDQDYSNTLICEKTNARNITDIEKLTFSYKNNTLGFILNALEYSAPLQNRVRYKMEGVDNDWLVVKSGTMVRYPGLQHGNYTLLVEAANSDGIYSDLLRKLEIRITPPYYKTWWFITLVALTSLAILFYIVYLNFSKRLELQNVRLRLYENLHDDVGSRLTAIVMSAEDLALTDNYKHPKLDRISGIAKSIVGNMRRLVWAIDPENDAVTNLAAKIRSDKSMILGDDINFHLNVGHEILQTALKGEIRYQLLSIINEALNNISKYAKAKNVWIDLTRKGKLIHLMIRDDGVGFDTGQIQNDKIKATGYGMKNMEKRVARVNGKLIVTSTPGEGTSITVTVPSG